MRPMGTSKPRRKNRLRASDAAHVEVVFELKLTELATLTEHDARAQHETQA